MESPLKSIFSEEYALLLRTLTEGRRDASLTQSQLASLLRRPQSFVSKYERKERRIDVVELVHICRILSIDPRKIVDDIEACIALKNGARK